jgi:hypothetical protein
MQETKGDTRFILKVRPTTKVAYVSIEVLTKSRINRILNINPHKEYGNINFSGFHHNPWELPGDT